MDEPNKNQSVASDCPTESRGPEPPEAPAFPLRISSLDGEVPLFPDFSPPVQNLSPDLRSFTFRYDSLIVEDQRGAGLIESRSSSIFKVAVRRSVPNAADPAATLPPKVPLDLSMIGFAFLTPGAEARLRMVVGDAIYTQTFVGPMNQDFRWQFTHPLRVPVGSDDEERLAVLIVASAESPGFGTALLTVDGIFGHIRDPRTFQGQGEEDASPRERLERARAARRRGDAGM